MLEELISSGAGTLGLTLPEGALARFRTYYELLTARNKEFNLTAIKGEEDAAKLHFLDCLGILKEFDFTGKRFIDVGTGGGFPGMVLAIAAPYTEAVLMDATEKKINFLWEVSDALELDVDCVHGRAEELGADGEWRESFDVAVSRAVARLNVLCELALPFVKVGGTFIAMKAADSDEEIDEAKSAIKALGGKITRVAEYTVPGTDIVRRAVIINKIAPTAAKYPRRYAKIQKSPL